MPQQESATVTVFASDRSWIESDAVEQCRQVAALDGMLHVGTGGHVQNRRRARPFPW